MSDALPDDAWASAFQTAAAKPLLTALQRRLHASGSHVTSVAELLHERSVIEQEYSAKLAKLARAADSGQLSGKGGIEWERNSGEAKLWNTLVSDLTEVSSSLGNPLTSDIVFSLYVCKHPEDGLRAACSRYA